MPDSDHQTVDKVSNNRIEIRVEKSRIIQQPRGLLKWKLPITHNTCIDSAYITDPSDLPFPLSINETNNRESITGALYYSFDVKKIVY